MYALTLLSALLFVPGIGAVGDTTTFGRFARSRGIVGLRACSHAPETDRQLQVRLHRLWMEPGK